MQKLIYLGLHRLIVLFIVISQSHNRDARSEIEIFFPFRIVKGHPVPMVKNDRIPVIRLIKFLFRLLNIFLFIRHGNTSHLPN